MKVSTKDRIIAAAARVAAERGVQNMTMDAVAEAAEISKGGVFYHFDSKHELLLAMVHKLVDLTEERIAVATKNDSGTGSWLRGFIAASVEGKSDERAPYQDLSIAFLTAAANDTTLLAPMNDRQAAWREAINASGIDPALAHIVRLAADGLWINDVMGVPVLDEAEREAVVNQLNAFTFPNCAAPKNLDA